MLSCGLRCLFQSHAGYFPAGCGHFSSELRLSFQRTAAVIGSLRSLGGLKRVFSSPLRENPSVCIEDGAEAEI